MYANCRCKLSASFSAISFSASLSVLARRSSLKILALSCTLPKNAEVGMLIVVLHVFMIARDFILERHIMTHVLDVF